MRISLRALVSQLRRLVPPLLAGFAGAQLCVLLWMPVPVRAYERDLGQFNNLQVHNLAVTNSRGQKVLELGYAGGSDSGLITLFDRYGKRRLCAWVTEEGESRIQLFDSNQVRAQLGARGNGTPYLEFWNEDGEGIGAYP